MGVLYIFWVWGRAIGKGIDFHDFLNWYRVGYAFSENLYKFKYLFLKNWYKVGYTFWKNWYKVTMVVGGVLSTGVSAAQHCCQCCPDVQCETDPSMYLDVFV